MTDPLRCSPCGAVGQVPRDLIDAVDGEDLYEGPCLACGHTNRFRFDEQLADYLPEASSPGPTRLARALRFAPPLLALPAGVLLVAAWHVFVWPAQGTLHSVPLGVLVGLVSVALALTGRGFAGAALAGSVGALLVAKVFAFPVGSSLTSETSMNYHTTGLALLVGAAFVAGLARGTLAIRRLKPRPLVLASFALGVGLGLAYFTRPIKAELWAAHRSELHTWTERLRTLALAIDDDRVHQPALPATIAAAFPDPAQRPAPATTEVVPVGKLRDPVEFQYGAVDHYRRGWIRLCLDTQTYEYRAAEFVEDHERAYFEQLATIRHLVAYDFPRPGRIVVWVADAEGKLRARLEASHDPSQEAWRVCDTLIDRLVFEK